MEARHHKTRGFTLIELLVVIGIVALLGSMLLAAFARARGKGLQAACLNNLRQINYGVRLYADDFAELFPFSGWTTPPSWTRDLTLVNGYLGVTGAPAEHPKIFACPADTFFYRFETMSRGYRVAQSVHDQTPSFSSYGFNAGNFPYGPNQVQQWPGIAGLKATSVKEPSKTVLLEEIVALSPYSWHEPAAAPGHYNNARCGLSFVDGHAEYLKIYWDAANARGAHLEAWQYDPPAKYGYRWSAY